MIWLSITSLTPLHSFTFFNYHLLQDVINHTYDITLDSRRPESALSYSEICCGYPSGYNLFLPRSVVETWPRIPIMLKDAEENEEIIFVKTYFAISFNRCCVRNDLHSVNCECEQVRCLIFHWISQLNCICVES